MLEHSQRPLRQDHWTFFLQWLKKPLSTAAVVPSGEKLVKAMLDQLPPQAKRVIELGAGTGSLTSALLKRGITPEDLLALELNADLWKLLNQRFPQLQCLQGSACDLFELAKNHGYLDNEPADAIISSLGLLAMDGKTQLAIMLNAFSCLKPAGVFIQFTYGQRAPLPEKIVRELNLQVLRGKFVLRNIPPATVYVYQKAESAGHTQQ